MLPRKPLPILFFLLLFAACNRGPHELAYAPQAEMIYKQQVTFSMATVQTINGQQLNTSNKLDMLIQHTVNPVTDSVTQIECRYLSINMETGIDSVSMKFSSENTSDTTATLQNLNPLLGILVNKPFLLSVNRQGQVLHASGFAAAEQEMGAAIGSNRFVKNQLIDLMRQSFGDKALASLCRHFSHIFPDNPVRRGDSWAINHTSHNGLTFDMSGTCTLKKIWRDKATIEYRGELHGSPSQNEMFSNNVNSRTNLSGTFTGIFECDLHTGYVYNGHIVQQITGTVHAVRTDVDEQIDMPFTSTITITQKAVE